MAGIMNNPLLTIIIPTLQAQQTLQESLDSVLCQQFRDFEVLIMDSVSRDNTLSIAGTYARRDDRIRIFSEPDKGVYDAMNKGIEKARGQWIFFLGSDDRLHDEKVLSVFFSDPRHPDYHLVYGNVASPSYRGVYDGVFSFEKLLSRNLPHQAVFYKKTIFGLIGQFVIRYKGYADWDLHIRCFRDERVRIHYTDLLVAWFGAGGVSSRHDKPFLREVLIPEKLRMLNCTGVRALRPVKAYDEWWRVIRNAGIRSLEQFDLLTGSGETPLVIKTMIRWQQRVSENRLRIGAFSKSLMFASYIKNRLTGAI
jgi:glycosyltransferase involved in cell wall biosynthesis